MSDAPRPVPRRAPWSEIKRSLADMGFRPARALGQNFLVDENMLRAIVRAAELEPGACVLEVGPGCGVLTAQLLDAGARVIAVELDSRLFQFARRFLGEEALEWIEGDALAGKHALHPEVLARLPLHGPWHLVSNLPYSAGTPILIASSRLPNPPRSATVLLQHDLGARIAAAPGSKEWGAVSVKLQALYTVQRLRTLPPQLFWPQPSVDSALLRLELRPVRPQAEDLARLDALVSCLFEQRRKTVLNRLDALWGDRSHAAAVCATLGVDPRSRPEELTVETMLALARSAPPAP